MRIHDILSTKGFDVLHLAPDASVRELVALLAEHNLGAVVVSTDGRTVTGIVSERDVVRRLASHPEVLDGPVAEIMSTDVRTCTADDTVETAMSLMTELRVRHLPVLDDRRELRGIVSIGDVVKSQISQLQFERDQLEGYVSG